MIAFKQLCTDVLEKADPNGQKSADYKLHTRKYIDAALSGKPEWDEETWADFFKRKDAVAAIGQGSPTKADFDIIKSNWQVIAGDLQALAQAGETFTPDLYSKFEEDFRSLALTRDYLLLRHRMAVCMQPTVMTTVVDANKLKVIFTGLHNAAIKYDPQFTVPEYTGDWYQDSHNLFAFIKSYFPEQDPLSLVSLPWGLYERFSNSQAESGDASSEDLGSESSLEAQIRMLAENQYNLILTGALGTGKTYTVMRVAQRIAGQQAEHVVFVQFHPSYDYTDFVEGLRPCINTDTAGVIGFARRDRIFKTLCKQAVGDPDNNYVMVIDEINRGDLSKIFGELFFLIDPDYRGGKSAGYSNVSTQYQNLVPEDDVFAKGFYVPKNVYIIGTMNDIDRSVDSLDFALRRRFSFREITAKDSMAMLESLPEKVKAACTLRMHRLNDVIYSAQTHSGIEGLSSAYHVGAAYFMKIKKYLDVTEPTPDDTELNDAFAKLWQYHLQSLLFEYLRGTPEADANLEKLHNAYNLTETLQDRA